MSMIETKAGKLYVTSPFHPDFPKAARKEITGAHGVVLYEGASKDEARAIVEAAS